MNRLGPLYLLLLCSVLADAQQASPNSCVLSSMSNGQLGTLNGKVVHGAHDMLLDIPNCEPIVLIYADEPEATTPSPAFQAPRQLAVRRDAEFKKFEKYARTDYERLPGGGHCGGCFKYEVEASFTGHLEIANIPEGLTKDSFGFLRDASGKIVGKTGFGHPSAAYNYRLVIESISNVIARKLPRKISDSPRP